MKNEIANVLANTDIKGWKTIEVAFGEDFLQISVPSDCHILNMKKMPPLAHSKDEILRALQNPIGSSPLEEILRSKGKTY